MPKEAGADAAGVRKGVEEMSASGGSLWKKQSWRWDIWVAIVTVVTGLLLAWVTQQLPQEELLKRALMRSVAPAMTPVYDHTFQHKITIVTIDDLDLKKFGQPWPLPYSFLSASVQAMLERYPKVLFIDLLLKREEAAPEMEALRKVICQSRGDTTVYIASIPDEMLPDSAMETLLLEGKDHDGKPCAKRINPQITSDKYDQSQWEYPVWIEADKAKHPDRSVAFEIFCDLQRADCPLSEYPEEHDKKLALIWPTVAFEKNLETMLKIKARPDVLSHPRMCKPDEPVWRKPTDEYEPACRDRTPPWEAVPGITLIEGLMQPEAKLPPCPYLRVTPLRALTFEGFSRGEVSDAFADKIVFVGADIVGSGDKIVSPVHGTLPGVHAHAMALNNLMTFQGRYKEAGDFDFKHLDSNGSLFVIISVISIVVMLTLWNHYFTEVAAPPPPRLSAWRGFLGCLGMIVLVLPLLVMGAPRGGATADLRRHLQGQLSFINMNIALIALIFVVGYVWLRQGPLSMVEYVLFPFLAHFLHLGKTIAERSRDWWHALWANNPWGEWAKRRAHGEPTEH
jgi:hypothetical protein